MGHKGESLLSKLSESSDNKDEEHDLTGDKDINGNKNGDVRGDRNNGAGKGSAEWIKFLSLGARTEALALWQKPKHPRQQLREKNEAGKK